MGLTEVKNSSPQTSQHGQVKQAITIIIEILLMIMKWWYFTIDAIIKLIVPPDETNVEGEIVLITGTGHGIGKQLALQYSALGSIVICIDINEQLNNETVHEIQEGGGIVHGFVCDVSNRADVFELSQKIKTQIGDVDIIVNNAGIMPTHSLLEHTEKEIRRVFEINVFGQCWMLQAFLPQMIENNKGHIVAISSLCGLAGMVNLVPYCGTKYAVRGIMDALEVELNGQRNKSNIKLTSVYPYMVDTGLCKKPYVRFPSLMSLVNTKVAATTIVQSQRRGVQEVSIPKPYYYGMVLTRLFPNKCAELVRDVFECGVESDLN